MMNRRKFFALLPAAPVALVTWPAEAKASPDDAPHQSSVMLTLNGTEKPNGEYMRLEKNMIINYPKNDPSRQVSMAVGMDGNLWLKTAKDEWKRVVTE